MPLLTVSAPLLEHLTFFNVSAALLVTLGILCILYPDRPIGVKSRSSLPSYRPAYPLVGSLKFILDVSFKKTRFLDEVLRIQQDVGRGGQPFTVAFPALGGRVTVINNPAYIQHVQKTNFENFPKGPDFKANMSDVLGPHGIFVVDGSPWYTQRKLASHIFSVANFNSHVQDVVMHSVQTKLDPLLMDLASRSDQDQWVAFPDLMFRFTLSSFAFMAFNADLQCLPAKVDGLAIKNEFASNFDFAQNVMDHRFFSVGPVWTEWFTSEGRQMRNSVKALHQYCYKIIDARLAARGDSSSEKKSPSTVDAEAPGVMSSKGGKDLLELFIEQGISRDDLLPVILNFLIAGRDTTAQSLAWMFFELWKNPQYIAKIRESLVPILGSPSEQRAMAFEDYKELPYLQACFYEAVRLHPAVPKNLKRVLKDDVIVPGPTPPDSSLPKVDLPPVEVKAGESVVWSDWTMARMPEVWGEDCAEFRPERFYDAEKNSCREFSQWKFHSFNGGPRVCLGKTLAVYEGMAVAAAILGRYDVIYDDAKLKTDPPTYQDSLTLPCSPYNVKFRLRPEVEDA